MNRTLVGRIGVVGLCVLGLALGRSESAPSRESRWDPSMADRVREALERYNELTTLPVPELDDERLTELLDGEVVRMQERWQLPEDTGEGKQRHRVLAYYLLSQPRLRTWVSAMDPHFLGNDRITEARLFQESGSSQWYQHMSLPWPVRDRHWVIDIDTHEDVAERSENMIWELSWQLSEGGEEIAHDVVADGKAPGLDLDDVDGARYLEANTGAWATLALDEETTLIAYQLTVVLGGWIPERLSTKFAMSALESLMRDVERNGYAMPAHYRDDHEPIYDGLGEAIGQPIPGWVESDGTSGSSSSIILDQFEPDRFLGPFTSPGR